ncbi:MAG: hypothetical protein QOH95_434, partial [Gaiellaceae bacterium]|nr:hypothetical protein [Gaiellaceae bacterium]
MGIGILVALGGMPGVARAADFVVNSTADVADPAPCVLA